MFFLTVWFQKERYEALLFVAIMGHVLWSLIMCEGMFYTSAQARWKIGRMGLVPVGTFLLFFL
jgi:hypothetical protein